METDERLETFIDTDDEWFSGIELRALDLEKELSRWRETRARQLAAAGLLREAGGPAAGRAEGFDGAPAGDRTRVLIDRGRRQRRAPQPSRRSSAR
jgi:hypothetical protein